MFFNILGADFLAPKSGHRREKQSVLGQIHSYIHLSIFSPNAGKCGPE